MLADYLLKFVLGVI